MTDRALADPAALDALAWDDRGLVPVIAQDAHDGRVLMLAWANREALLRSLETGELHFWSRSRQASWRKGETSGNTLRLVSLHADCDGDAVLARVEPAGPACHTGEATCFGEGAAAAASLDTPDGVLAALEAVLDDRAARMPEGSYTTKLLADENLRLKKLGEETVELVTALARGEDERSAQEAADLLYHLLVALRAAGVSLASVTDVLRDRRG